MEFLRISIVLLLLEGCEIPPKLPPGDFTSTKYFQACENKDDTHLNCAFLDKNSINFKTDNLVIANFTRLTYSDDIEKLINWSGTVMIDCEKSKIAYKYIDEPNMIWSDLTESKNVSLNKLMSEACKHHG